MRWYWVRHGPTHAKTMVGWTDLPTDLTDHQALWRLDQHLPVDAPLVSSDLTRASATAAALNSPRTVLPSTPALREINFGRWENQRFDAVEINDAAHIRTFWEQPGDITAPGGESWNMLCARVNLWVDETVANSSEPAIIAVAHMGVILTQVQRALGITAYEALSHKIDNLSVTLLIYEGGNWSVQGINHKP